MQFIFYLLYQYLRDPPCSVVARSRTSGLHSSFLKLLLDVYLWQIVCAGLVDHLTGIEFPELHVTHPPVARKEDIVHTV